MQIEKNPLLAKISGAPMLLDPNAVDFVASALGHLTGHEQSAQLMARASAYDQDNSYWPEQGSWQCAYKPYVVHNGTLFIPIYGVLLNNYDWQVGRWVTGYTYIMQALRRGLSDHEVKRICFMVDSPGGEVAGNFELSDQIYNAREQKLLFAIVDTSCYSAAYSLASACQEIILTRSAGVGSIGVITMHVDYTKAMDNYGVKVTLVYAGAHKADYYPYKELTDSAKQRLQSRVDKTYNVFAGTVARNRGIDESAVKATEALTYDAEDGIRLDLADRIGQVEETLKQFEAAAGDTQMAIEKENTVTMAERDSAVEAATASAKATGFSEGMAAQKTRVNAILALEESKDKPRAALSAAVNTSMSVDEAKAFLGGLAAEEAPASKGDKTEHFNTKMAETETNVAAGGEQKSEKDSQDMSAAILSDYANSVGLPVKAKIAN